MVAPHGRVILSYRPAELGKVAVAPRAGREAPRAFAGFAGADHLEAEPGLLGQRVGFGAAPLRERRTSVAAQTPLRKRGELPGQFERTGERAARRGQAIREPHAERLVTADAPAGQ